MSKREASSFDSSVPKPEPKYQIRNSSTIMDLSPLPVGHLYPTSQLFVGSTPFSWNHYTCIPTPLAHYLGQALFTTHPSILFRYSVSANHRKLFPLPAPEATSVDHHHLRRTSTITLQISLTSNFPMIAGKHIRPPQPPPAASPETTTDQLRAATTPLRHNNHHTIP